VWLHDPELQTMEKLDPTLGCNVLLRPGEIMEVEWIGCEFVHEKDFELRIDNIRLAKTMKIRSLEKSNVVGVYSGWVIEDILSFKSGNDEFVKRFRMTSKSKHKFDIQKLFTAKGFSYDKEAEQRLEPQDIH
jgi:hypothetical protein